MGEGPFWLTEPQFARLAPHLPTDNRGVPRVDDRRVISGIVQVLRSGCRWKDAPEVHGPRKTLYNRFVRWARKGVWGTSLSCAGRGRRAAERAAARQLDDEGAPLCLWGQRGERAQGIGISRGGRTSKLHALSDEHGRPRAFVLTGGQAADFRAAEALLGLVTADVLVIADRGYDTNAVRRAIEAQGATPNIPPKVNQRWKPPFSRTLYRSRNAIERMFGRLKDYRRIATRYDKLAANFLAAVHLVATVCHWL